MYDRALTGPRPILALTDLQLLLQINKAAVLGTLDSSTKPSEQPGRPADLADQVGTTFRPSQAYGVLGQILFETGRGMRPSLQSHRPRVLEGSAAACDEFAMPP